MSFLFENQFVSAFKTINYFKVTEISDVGEIRSLEFKKTNSINRKFVGISPKYAFLSKRRAKVIG